MPEVDCSFRKRGLLQVDEECGDTGCIRIFDGICFVALVDGLGHDSRAREAARYAESFFAACTAADLEDLPTVMRALAQELRASRGAVVALCVLHLDSGQLRHTGIGNITTRIFTPDPIVILSREGIVGQSMRTPLEKHFQLVPGDLVMLYSDGIRTHFETYDCPGLLTGNAAEITARVLECFYKGDDDGSCLVLRYLP